MNTHISTFLQITNHNLTVVACMQVVKDLQPIGLTFAGFFLQLQQL